MPSNNPTNTIKRKVSSQVNTADDSLPIPGWKKIRVPGDDITLPIYEDSKPFVPFSVEIELLMKEILKDPDLDLPCSPSASPVHSEDESDELEETVNEDGSKNAT
ncbi:hypothetical protein IL306_000985, partial [Fusarium sp. DS 682]